MKNRKPENGDELPIRNSTAEFLVCVQDDAADTVAVRFQDRILWLTLQPPQEHILALLQPLLDVRAGVPHIQYIETK